MSGAPLAFSGVEMRFPNGTVALTGVDLRIAPGEFVALLGPSGCGKSTLLRLASGLDTPTSGTVDVGSDRIGYVFQDATLLPWLSVEKNAALFGELDHLPRSEVDRRVRSSLDLVGLGRFAKHLPHQLSGGMRMRASLARSLVNEPNVFLFDEPFGALDEMTREKLNDDVRALWLDRGFTGVFVTHSIAEAVYMATRVVVMGAHPGRVIAEYAVPFGDTRDELTRYSPQFASLCAEISDTLKEASA
ncbi:MULTISPECIES: ABC transporter ATP-binding protein [Microbacterium]|jgi:NitT/TauT family transport system ATP-binding protein|uniref:ABC transporter ATP-binding protein n=1 Tax=Microbacterium TaxID=33882 RepID=UPI001D17D086|nr:ABC transporter ATP-binding protein [Microbacterium testaceum]MCC4248288.1 ABC transporter ATP-binding protein [Microbacterium testaceum]